MEPGREVVLRTAITRDRDRFLLSILREDFSAVYPALVRYTVNVSAEDRILALFRTNSYEYSPLVPLRAGEVAMETARAWEAALQKDPRSFFEDHSIRELHRQQSPPADLVMIQGSPRGDGNCSILAGWVAGTAADLGRPVQVIYPHDLDIHCCIGCYQCYNTGTCVFQDDMAGIIDAIRGASVIVICSPVYTETVPAGLKLVIDRAQAYHAERMLSGGRSRQKGITLAVAGRKGTANFLCVTRVLDAFFINLGIIPSGEILVDNVDAARDIRRIPGLEEKVRALVLRQLFSESAVSSRGECPDSGPDAELPSPI